MKLVIKDFDINQHLEYIEQLQKALERMKQERDAYKMAYEALLKEDEFDMDGRCWSIAIKNFLKLSGKARASTAALKTGLWSRPILISCGTAKDGESKPMTTG